MADEETPLRPAISTSAGTSSSTASTAGTTPIRRPSFLLSKLPPPPPLEPETAAKKTSKAVKLAIYVFGRSGVRHARLIISAILFSLGGVSLPRVFLVGVLHSHLTSTNSTH